VPHYLAGSPHYAPSLIPNGEGAFEPNGAPVFFNDVRPDAPKIFHTHYARLIDSYTSTDARILPDGVRQEAILLALPFNLLERISAIERRLVPLERFVDRALSLSTSSPEQLRPFKGRLAQEITDQMSRFATYGAVVGVIESQALPAEVKRTPFADPDRKPRPRSASACRPMLGSIGQRPFRRCVP
jgi:hypothetical protein